ncbi:siderophore ABC transporter substrate-binding protein [Clostridium sp. B9]|uniref:siderophore ABC transporter substrate-binding protein n=1 Tax=Clostridium sp. B9 TaxID=3423224 RepID=UPI003D2F3662
MNKKVLAIVGISIAVVAGGFALLGKSGESTKVSAGVEMVKVSHRKGEIEVPKNPEKVVVLDYSSLDIIDEMNKESKVVGLPKSSLPDYLDEFKGDEFKDLGSLKEFSLETINELDPDLIIIEGRQEKQYDELSKIAPTLFLGREGNDHFGSLKNNAKTLGVVFGEENFIDEKMNEINKRIEGISSKASNLEEKALVTMVYDGEITTFGKESRFGMIHNEFGFKQVDENIATEDHGQTVSNEYIANINPGYLFVIDKGIISSSKQEPAKDIIENELVQRTDAYKNGNITYLDTKAWYLGGPGLQSTDVMLSEIEKSLNK